MTRRYPVITGIGLVSPLGTGRVGFAEALFAGHCAVRPRPSTDQDPVPCKLWAPVVDFDATRLPGQRKQLKLMTRAVTLGLGAAFQALEDAGLTPGSVPPSRFGGYVGAPTTHGEGQELEPALAVATREGHFNLGTFASAGLPLVNPLWLVRGLSNNVLGFISAAYRMMGPNLNLCCSGAGGLQAIGEAAQAIRDDRADVCLAGGYDSILHPQQLALYSRLGLLTAATDPEHGSRPFHAQRDGFVPAEGGAFVVVEELERARARQTRIWGHVMGYSSTNCAYDLAAPGEDGRAILSAASNAIREAGISPVEVGLVVAHASGSVVYDAAEAGVLRRLFGPSRDRIPVTAPKSMFGHTIAASGSFGAVCLLLALASKQIPPTLHLDEVAPGCELNHVRPQSIPWRRQPHGLVVAAGLGGQQAALYLSEGLL